MAPDRTTARVLRGIAADPSALVELLRPRLRAWGEQIADAVLVARLPGLLGPGRPPSAAPNPSAAGAVVSLVEAGALVTPSVVQEFTGDYSVGQQFYVLGTTPRTMTGVRVFNGGAQARTVKFTLYSAAGSMLRTVTASVPVGDQTIAWGTPIDLSVTDGRVKLQMWETTGAVNWVMASTDIWPRLPAQPGGYGCFLGDRIAQDLGLYIAGDNQVTTGGSYLYPLDPVFAM